MANKLTISQVGLNACGNAKAGGFLIDIDKFSIGDGSVAPSKTDLNLSGSVLYTSPISIISALSTHAVQFTLDIPRTDLTFSFREVAIYLSTGELFARGVFDNILIKDADISMRMLAYVALVALDGSTDLTTISVTTGNLNSIPSVPFVHNLPSPDSVGEYNAIAVLDQKYNLDASTSGSMVIKYSNSEWSFLGYSRVALSLPDSQTGNILTTTQFSIASMLSSFSFENDELVIVQVISGPGKGESRKFKYDSTLALFVEADGVPFSALTHSSMLAVWKMTESANTTGSQQGTCVWPPDMRDVPSDWILTRGSSCPTWQSPTSVSSTGSSGSSGLFIEQSFLKPNYVYFTGNGAKTTFDTGLSEISILNTIIAIDGVTQHKESYDVQNSYIMFSEAPPPGTLIEVLIFTNELSQGVALEFHVDKFNGDGISTRFELSASNSTGFPSDAQYVLCYITGFKQSLNSFLYEHNDGDAKAYIVFNEAPPSGVDIQVTYIIKADRIGYSTVIHTNTFFGTNTLEVFELSVTPESQDQLLVTVSGVLMHNSTFTLSGNKLIIPDSIKQNLSINVLIFENVLSGGRPSQQLAGVVTGALLTDRYIRLLRYNSPDFLIPNQRVNLFSGTDIEILGDFPNYTIKSNIAATRKKIETKRFSTVYSQDNVEEIVFTYNFIFDYDSIVTITADFSMQLGPGFRSASGDEYAEYVLGFKSANVIEPPYGRRVKGTGFAGFAALPNTKMAYCNASITQSYEMNLTGHATETVTFVAKMRIQNGNVSSYKNVADINFSLVAVPKALEVTLR